MSTSKGVALGSLPMRLFTRGTEPEFKRSFTYHSGLESLPVLSNQIPKEELDQIKNGPLGVLLRFYENEFMWSARVVHELLVHQLVTNKKYEFWTLCGGQAMRFSLKEFEVITGLNCEAYPVEHVNIEDDPQFWRRLGLVENREPSYKMIEEKIMNCKDWNSRDRIRLVYLFLVFRFLLARHPGTGIVAEAAFLVLDREKFEAYPWGRVAFQHLIESIFQAKQDLSHDSYIVNGFVQVLQVWAYEAIPAIGKKCVNPRKDMMEFPPLLRWKGSRKRFKYDLSQNRESVSVKGVMDNILTDLWDDELQDDAVDNMLLLISGSSGRLFEKHFWEDKGLIDGPEKMVEEEADQISNGEGMPPKKKHKSKVTGGNDNDALKTYFASAMEQMADKLQKQICAYVDDAVKKIDSRMEKIEEGIRGIQEKIKGVQEAGPMKETGSQKKTTCSNKPGGKKSKPLSRYELKDISVEDLPTEEDTIDCKVDSANSREEVQSSLKALSETSSIRDRLMNKQMTMFAAQVKALTKQKPIKKEKRIIKLTAPLKDPFTSSTNTKKIKTEDQPRTAYDPFELVKETSVVALDEWMSSNLTVPCGNNTDQVGKVFFQELRTPQIHISNSHIDAGMALFRRRSLMTPCPYRGGRMAFMDSGFTVAIAHNYKEFKKDPKNYTWKSGAAKYYSGVMPIAGCTNKQLGKDVDDIYVVIHVKTDHWAALAISIPNRIIHVYDSIIGYTAEKEMQEYVEPYMRMIPYMLKAFASEKKGLSVAKYHWKIIGKIPQNKIPGDCGIYAIKYIECLALWCEFKGLCDEHIKGIRAKLAAEIFDESKNVGFY